MIDFIINALTVLIFILAFAAYYCFAMAWYLTYKEYKKRMV